MSTHEVKKVVFHATLQPAEGIAAESETSSSIQLCRHSEKPTHYSILSQSREDLQNPENSPSVSMWPYLLASAQTQRLNEISIYAEHGTTPDKIRFLYLNDFALTIWAEMSHGIQVMGRLYRPPRGAVLSFGMPFSE